MVKCLREPDNPTKCNPSHVLIHCSNSSLQNTRETAFAIRKLHLNKAKKYLEDVLGHKQAIPLCRFCHRASHTAQAKNRHSNGQGHWLVKSATFILNLLKNAESNAEERFQTITSSYYRGAHGIIKYSIAYVPLILGMKRKSLRHEVPNSSLSSTPTQQQSNQQHQ
ncbi:hypothetical protein UlMin_021709 [Ulmus minor]